jgi:glucans biosynthesis protein
MLAGGVGAAVASFDAGHSIRAAQAITPEDTIGPFGATTVRDLAEALAAQPHRTPDAALPQAFRDLDYDGYRKIRFDEAHALWADSAASFRLIPNHRGFLFRDRVALFEVAGGEARALRYDPAQFRFEGMAAPEGDLGFAGFRLTCPLNRPDHFDELCVFLGASYFRAVGQGQVYGLSARALAIATAEPRGEEFPALTAFWVERPEPGARAITIHALLESPSVTGAYRFVVTPGVGTAMEVSATLFPRVDLAHVGIAPATSMFYFGPQDREGISDVRPAVHDSDGLLIETRKGERIWRPLANPRDLQISGFQEESPRGFGLLQRPRDFEAYQDLEASYHRRPHLWVEPLDPWGPGEIHLVEIPTRGEIHDNIVAAWRPRAPLPAGIAVPLRYRLTWTDREAEETGVARFAQTRMGQGGGLGRQDGTWLFVLDTQRLAARDVALPEVELTTSAGEVAPAVVQRNEATGGLRISFALRPGQARLAELRLRLKRDGQAVSETWSYRWTT